MIQTENDKKRQKQTTAAAEDYDAGRELEKLGTAINSRRSFSYNPNSDPMYRSYARQYQLNGRLAMKNSMGQAAALTGGYGSSYGAAVGQQQYDEYLRRLSEQLPELYEFAYQRYADEGDALMDQYDMAYQRYESDYQRQKDALAEQQRQEQQIYSRRQDSYNSLVKLISGAGYSPTDDELNNAGMTRAQADALLNRYLMENGLLPGTGGGGGGGYRSGGAKKKKSKKEEEKKNIVKPGAQAISSAKGSGIASSGAGKNSMVQRSVRI